MQTDGSPKLIMWRADDTKTAAKSNQTNNKQTKNQNQKPIKKKNCEIIIIAFQTSKAH